MATREAVTALVYDARPAQAGAQAFEVASQKVVQANNNAVAATERVQVATAGYERALNRLRGQVDPAFQAQQRIASATQTVERAMQRGSITTEQGARIIEQARVKWLGHAAAIAAATLTLGDHPRAANEAAVAVDALGNSHDRARGKASQMREGMVLVHEFLRGDWKRAVGSATIELQNFGALGLIFNPVTLGLVALSGAAALVFYRAISIEEGNRRAALSLRALGDAAGVTGAQMRKLERDLQHQGASADEAKAALDAVTERIAVSGETRLREVTKLAQDMAATGRIGLVDAAGAIADLSQKGIPAIDALDERFHLLTASEREQIVEMARHGDTAGAVALVMEKLHQRFDGANKDVSAGTQALRNLKTAWDEFLESAASSKATEFFARVGTLYLRLASNALAPDSAANAAADKVNQLYERITRAEDLVRGLESSGFETPALQRAREGVRQLKEEYEAAYEAARRLGVRTQGEAAAGVPSGGAIGAGGVRSATAIDGSRSTADLERQLKAVQKLTEADRDQLKVLGADADQRDLLRARLAAEREATEQNITGETRDAFIRERIGVIIAQRTAAAGDLLAALDAETDANLELAKAQAGGAAALARLNAETEVAARVRAGAINEGEAEALVLQSLAKNAAAAANEQAKLNRELRLQNAGSALVAAAGGNTAAVESARRMAEAGQAFDHKIEEAQGALAAARAGGADQDTVAQASQALEMLEREKAARLELLRIRDLTADRIRANAQLGSGADEIAVLQKTLELQGGNVELRGREVAALQEKLRIEREFPSLDDATKQSLIEQAALRGELTAKIKENDQAEQNFRTIAREGIADITSGFEDAIFSARKFSDVLKSVALSLQKLAFKAAFEQPLNRFIDNQIGSGGLFGSGSGGQGGGLIASGASWLKNALGFGPSTGPEITPNSVTGAGGLAIGGGRASSAGDELGAAANDLTGSAAKLTTAGSGLAGVPNIFQRLLGQQIVPAMQVTASVVNVSGGGSAGGAGGLGGFENLFSGASDIAGGGYASLLGGSAETSAALAGSGTSFADLLAVGAIALHDGGTVGIHGTPRAMPRAAFRDAPRFHDGVYLAPDERMAILQTGEQVRSRAQVANDRASSSRSGASVVNNFNFAAGTDRNISRQTMNQLSASALSGLAMASRR